VLYLSFSGASGMSNSEMPPASSTMIQSLSVMVCSRCATVITCKDSVNKVNNRGGITYGIHTHVAGGILMMSHGALGKHAADRHLPQ